MMLGYSNSNSDSNSKRQCSWCCRRGTATARVHPVHLMNVARAPGRRQPLDQAGWLEPIDPPKLAAML